MTPFEYSYALKSIYDKKIKEYDKKIKETEKNVQLNYKGYEQYRVNANDIGFANIGWKFVFSNGYGASVINTGYGNEIRII